MVTIKMQDPRPIYTQIVDGVKEQVVKGMLKPNDQVPSIRQLASMLAVTPNTVSKAYQELERQGVIVSVKGKGNFINEVNDMTTFMAERSLNNIKEELRPLCIKLKYESIDKEVIKQVIDEIYDELEGR